MFGAVPAGLAVGFGEGMEAGGRFRIIWGPGCVPSRRPALTSAGLRPLLMLPTRTMNAGAAHQQATAGRVRTGISRR
jgi:hypothetical protein